MYVIKLREAVHKILNYGILVNPNCSFGSVPAVQRKANLSCPLTGGENKVLCYTSVRKSVALLSVILQLILYSTESQWS